MLKELKNKVSVNVLLQDIKRHRTVVVVYALGLLFCCFLLFLWLVPVHTRYEDIKARIASTEMLVERYRSKLKEAEAFKEELEKRREEVEKLRDRLYKGRDPLELATSLGRIAESEQGKNPVLSVRSYQISSTKDYQLYREVEFRFVLDADIYGLYSLLKWLDESPALIVRQLNVRYVRRGRNESGLMVNLVLTVLMEKKG
ncbi:hypothetical protein [Thermodesulforhabdus norvegica]|uniref:Uncharacterized protein n=1 Tax=Thermodesulforhabdus norvegica TaxID=39841 RepID=A0A1I4SRW8_9BACT|nr:hypothetical protein [Thermodesulforhabdus norvegica]SFM67182.1 hypothetical protein SAMN05660836_01130 [Thermodesulforhabdus norvegica]